MKQFCLFIVMCMFAMLKPATAQFWDYPNTVINGVAYDLFVDFWDDEFDEPLRTAVVKSLSVVTSEKYTGNVVIPESVEYDGNIYYIFEMYDSCFVDCENLESVTFTTCVSISDCSFINCPALKRIEMGNIYSMDWTYIGVSGISDCPNLKELILSPDLTYLDNNAIEAKGLERLKLPEKVVKIRDKSMCLPNLKELICMSKYPPGIGGSNPFGSGDRGINLKECVLRVPARSIELYKTADYWKDFGQILPLEDVGAVAPEADAESGQAYNLLGRRATGKGLRIINGKKTLTR